MQTRTITSFLNQIQPEHRYSAHQDQGFAQQEMESLIIPKQEIVDEFALTKQIERKAKIKYRQPKLKLTFISKDKNSQQELRRNIMKKQGRQFQGKSLELHKKESKMSIQNELISQCVTKIKRTVIGQNILIPGFSFQQSKNTKSFILNQNTPIHYESPRQTNTHGYLRSLGIHLLQKDINKLLKIKLKDSFIMPKKQNKQIKKPDIQFSSEFQSANLQFVVEVAQNQFDLYLKNDTNTHGHQAWFNFRIKNNKTETSAVKINICNIKRDLKMFQDCQKVYTRKVNDLGYALQDWKIQGNHLEFKINNNNKFTTSKVFKLSFEIDIPTNVIYQVSLLPSYTYSEMIKDIALLENNQFAKIQILTYSLTGLAIPILTFTNTSSNHHKNVILVNCRIHPGQTNASFICKGLIKELSSKKAGVKEFLDRNIIKIIPILNPDGVVLGNFRTNFLGEDLNRAFDSQDEVVNPEIVALKEIGMKLKRQYGDRFNLFLDLHGHSSQKNIFAYGPDYDSTETNFYQIRLFPKLLNAKSSLFKYYSCTFKLEDYKRYTARGFFLNQVNVNAYTIQASYGSYQQQGKNMLMGLKQWVNFGHELVDCLNLLYKINKLSMIRNKSEIKKALNEADKEQIEIIKKFKKEFKKEKQENILNMKHEKKKNHQDQDSDGQNECQDYSKHERQQVLRRVVDISMPNIILPKVMKPSVLYPTVTPKLFKIRDEIQSSNLKVIFTRRHSKYNSLRMQGNNLIHSIKGIEMLRYEAKNLLS